MLLFRLPETENPLFHNNEAGRRYQLIKAVFFIAIPIFSVFAVYHFANGNIIPFIANSILLTIQFFFSVFLFHTKWKNPGLRLTLFCYGIYFYTIILIGGSENSYIIWTILFPIIAIVFFPIVEAVTWILIFLLGYLIINILAPVFLSLQLPPLDMVIRVFTIQVLATLMMYISEKLRITLMDRIRINEKELLKEKENAERSREIAMDALQVKNRFLATVSHEIRTPLSLITGMSELALSEKNNDILHEYIDHIHDSSRHLLMLINNLLDFSKIESDSFLLESTTFNLCELSEKIKNTFLMEFNRKDLTLDFICDDSLNRFFRGDEMRIRQIITNLMSNACKYTDKGNVTFSLYRKPVPEKESGSESKISWISFSVSDTGKGIKKEKMSLIFEPFAQLYSEYDNASGVGLGLAISKKLVELMGGKIEVTGREDRGTTFTVDLPLREEEAGQVLSGNSTARTENKTELSILFADDNPSIVKMVSRILTKEGHLITTAENGYEALSLLEDRPFDIVMLDIEMPRLNGIETARRIRDGELGQVKAGIPIIAFTAHVFSEMEDQCKNALIDGFIKKPFETCALNDEILKIYAATRSDKRFSQ
jgi:signal transduction histidine kinase/CheY-like chemotaxis protein